MRFNDHVKNNTVAVGRALTRAQNVLLRAYAAGRLARSRWDGASEKAPLSALRSTCGRFAIAAGRSPAPRCGESPPVAR